LVEISLILISSVVGVLLGGFWLVFFLFEDRKKPEPRSLITETFLLGIATALAAAGLEYLLAGVFGFAGNRAYLPLPIFLNGSIEEILKFLAVFLFVRKSRFFDEPVDFMVYMITVALGFAAIENLLFLHTVTSLDELFSLASLRLIGATLMHALSSGLLGYFWAKKRLFQGIAAASLLHGFFNYLILNFGPMFFPTILLVGVSFALFGDFDKLKNIKKIYERRR